MMARTVLMGIVGLCIGFLMGYMVCENVRPDNVDGFFMSHNVVCYNYLSYDAELTKAHEEVHAMIYLDKDLFQCGQEGCYNHFCGKYGRGE